MEVINDNKCVAQGAAAWQEKETREQVMRDLESVHGYVDSYFQINGYVYVWAIQELPHTRAIEIAERGNPGYWLSGGVISSDCCWKSIAHCSVSAGEKKLSAGDSQLYFAGESTGYHCAAK